MNRNPYEPPREESREAMPKPAESLEGIGRSVAVILITILFLVPVSILIAAIIAAFRAS